jgi:hypothetical protein
MKSSGAKRASVKTLTRKITNKPSGGGRKAPSKANHGHYNSGSKYGRSA